MTEEQDFSQEEHERSVHAARWPELLDIPEVPKEGLEEMEVFVKELVDAGTNREEDGQSEGKEES